MQTPEPKEPPRGASPPALSHVARSGGAERARMVDVTAKDETVRVAAAAGRVVMQPATLRLLLRGEIAKGNVLTTAQVAGVMAAKRTSELIPMCHPLLLTGIACAGKLTVITTLGKRVAAKSVSLDCGE